MPGTITSDLVDISTAESVTGWTGTGGGGGSGGALAINDDNKIQGTYCISYRVSNATGTVYFQTGAGVNLTGQHVFLWWKSITAASLDTKANTGMGVKLGSNVATDTDYKIWKIFGSDNYKDGGWRIVAVDPTSTADTTLGTYSNTAARRFGTTDKFISAVTGANTFHDVIRYGTGLTITAGTSGAPVTFADILATDNSNTNQWGILREVSGILYGNGKMKFGDGTTSTYFKDTNKVLVYENYPVAANFYEIQVLANATFVLGNLSGSLASGGCVIKSSGTKEWTLTSSAGTSLIYASTLNNMRSGSLSNTSVIRNSVINSCGNIVTNGASLVNTTVSNTTAATTSAAITVKSTTEMAAINNCSFTGNSRAIRIELTGATGQTFNFTLDNLNFSGNTFDFQISAPNNSIINLNVTNGGNASTYEIVSGTGITVNINNSVTLTLTGIVTGSEVRIYDQTSPTPNELTGIESTTGSTFQYTYNYIAGTLVDIVVHKEDYIYYRIENYELGSSSASLPIAQIFDRNYEDPV